MMKIWEDILDVPSKKNLRKNFFMSREWFL